MLTETSLEYKYITKWQYPRFYMGASFTDYFLAYSRNRDSKIMENVNFDAIVKALESANGEDIGYYYPEDTEQVFLQRSNHFGVGWVDIILIHESETNLLSIADDLLRSLAEYPCLDDTELSRRESESCQELWEDIPLREKIEHCQRNGISVFSARLSEYPSEVYDTLSADM